MGGWLRRAMPIVAGGGLAQGVDVKLRPAPE